MTTTTTWIHHAINDLPLAQGKVLRKALRNHLPLNRRLRKILIKAGVRAEAADIADCLTQKEYQE